MASFVRIMVLIWADIVAVYAVWVMMTYLTNVWMLNFTHAAAIVNVFLGSTMIMPTGMTFLVDAFMGDYCMLLLSSLAYCFGLSFLAMSTPPVLSQAAGNCSAYQPDCIGNTQKVLFYTALALIAVGLSGNVTSLGSFFGIQTASDQIENERKFYWQFLGAFAVIIFAAIGGIALPFIKPWSLRFGIPAICTVVATLLFLSGSCSYKHARPLGSPLTALFRVFVAAASKLFQRTPRDANQLYEIHGDGVYYVPHTRGLRCLDKAAVISSNKTLEQQQQNRWRLCRVTEVEETKMAIRMIPMWMTFIMCGVVSAIGNTYFLEQANRMNPKVGHLKVPLPIFLMFYEMANSFSVKIYVKIASTLNVKGLGEWAPSIGFVIAMISSVLCCITAAKIEARRLDVVKSHNLLDKPEERIPMTIFWLLPQYLLLGALDGISSYSIVCFFIDQVPPSLSRYLIVFSSAVNGVGVMGSVLSVYIVGKVSERGGKPSWFQDTLNKSRLDNYYWTLAVMSAVNLVLFILVALWYTYQGTQIEDIEAPGYEESAQPYDDNTQCCCCCG